MMGLIASILLSVTELAEFERLYGPADVTAVSGAGGLTVGVNGYGRWTVCRWPSPGYDDQLAYRATSREAPSMGVPADHGAMWGIRMGGETRWLSGPPWESSQRYLAADIPIVETSLSAPGSSLHIKQTLFAHPGMDVAVCRIEVSGADSTPELYWYGNFAPCARHLSGAPIADWLLDSLNDFAAFVSGDGPAVVSFRPDSIAGHDHARARRLLENRASLSLREWGNGGKGVWIACTSEVTVRALHCGEVNGPSSAYTQASAGVLEGQHTAVGAVNSVMALRPRAGNGVFTATVFTAFGARYTEAVSLLEDAQSAGYEKLREETERWWRARFERNPLFDRLREPWRTAAQRCLTTLAFSTDRQTGATVRAPLTQPPVALTWPEQAAWAVQALDAAGLTAEAERLTLFLANAIREEAGPDKPVGSMPFALYTDGAEALPPFFTGVRGAGWTLWSFATHAERLPASQRELYLRRVWDGVSRAMEFLIQRADGHSGELAPAFDPERWRDDRSVENLLASHMGAVSALNIAGILGESRPEWREQAALFHSEIRRKYLDNAGAWISQDALPQWPHAVYPPGDPGWREIAERWLERAAQTEGLAALEALSAAAVIAREERLELPALRERFETILTQGSEVTLDTAAAPGAIPDALRAAWILITLETALTDK